MNICYINMFRLFDGYYKTFRKSETFRAKKKIIDDHAGSLYASLQKNEAQRNELSQQKEVDNAKIKELQEKFITTRNEFQQYVDSKNKELQKEFHTNRNEIIKELHDIIKAEAADKKYDLMFDISGFSNNNVPVVLHYDESKEITNLLLTKLNAGYEEEIKAIINTRGPGFGNNALTSENIAKQ